MWKQLLVASTKPGLYSKPFTMGNLRRPVLFPHRTFINVAGNKTNVVSKTPTTLFESRTFFKLFSKPQLSDLENKANENPNDASLQSQLISAYMAAGKYEDVINRVSSGKYSIIDTQSKVDYFQCLLAAGRSEQLNQLLQNVNVGEGITTTTTATTATTSNGTITPNTFGVTQNTHNPIKVEIITTKNERIWSIVKAILVIGGIGLVIYWYINTTQKSNQLPFSITPAHQEVWNVETKFADVKGVDEAKDELAEIVEYLKNPQKFAKLGARLPKGVLLEGEPGTGKTLLARALAGEAGVPFLYTSGSSFDEMFVGVGPKRIRQLFEDAKKLAPCIIFIDEIDSVGANRKYSQYSSSSKESTLNQLLTEMDGFKSTTGIVVIGATNFAESLDPAITRPGRFDKHVTVPLPDLKGRKEIIDLYLSKTVPSNGVNSLQLARGTPGFTGADLANLINIAAVKATMQGKPYVDEHVIEEAKDQILMGLARKNQEMDPLTRKVTAYHEGGHALVALYSEGAIPLHKATIIQRGSALGVTVMLPEKDETLISRKKLLARIAVSMGGRAAEELIFGDDDVTGGASSDFQNATSIAYHMVTRLGMSKKIGNISHNLYLDKNKLANISEQERQLIDQEVKEILNKQYDQAKTLLKKHEQELHRLAAALLEYETLTVEEIKLVIAGKPFKKEI